MAFDERLAERVRSEFSRREVAFDEKRMMGGLCFMVDGKMCVGVDSNRLMVRLAPEVYDEALTRRGCGPMDFTGKPMRGFVFVSPEGMRSAHELGTWIDAALEFNPRAKASRSRTSKKSKGTNK